MEFHMNYEERDTYGMYRIGGNAWPEANGHSGPGPRLMGTDTLNGNDVFNEKDEDLGCPRRLNIDHPRRLNIDQGIWVAIEYCNCG